MPEHLYSEQSAELLERQSFLELFQVNPLDPKLWDEAYAMVRKTSDQSLPGDTTITGEQLIQFANTVRATPQLERYALTTQLAPDNRLWFDVLATFSSAQIERAKRIVLQDAVEQNGRPFDTALDLGTGTGKSLSAVEAVSKNVVGLDRNSQLLSFANTIKDLSTKLVRADATALPFADESFGLITSSGLIGSLDTFSSNRLYREIARTLIPHGIYVDASWAPNHDGYEGQEMASITHSPEAMLTDMIVDSVSGGLLVPERQAYEDRIAVLGALGLAETDGYVADDIADDGTLTYVRIIQKMG